MRQPIRTALLGLLATGILSAPAVAGNNLNGNGFPSGPHFNLNIIGKQDTFSCPAPSFYLRVIADNNIDGDLGALVESCDDLDVCEATDIQVYGNVVFVPRSGGGATNTPISILMESGRKGPKGAPAIADLQVADWCSESFPDSGGTGAGDPGVVRLPQNDEGYAVFARITGKPGDQTSFSVVPDLVLVQDEAGNDLISLGLVTPTGVFNPDGILLRRTSDTGTGKRVQKATDITPLFQWTGDVCYVQSDWALYCTDPLTGQNLCSARSLCCVDATSDGAYDRCDLLPAVGIDPDGDGNYECPATDSAGISYLAVEAQCRAYSNQWVFNIGDFVDVLWNVENSGSYVVQVRFYPLPLQ